MMTRGEQVLVALRNIYGKGNEYDMPFRSTQDGLAETLGISRGHVSQVLGILLRNGYVDFKMAHAGNGRARRMCYVLTMSGYVRSSEIMYREAM